ncbi:hypothetical protein GCK32_015658, partial [Trichostrongylus colubriformis]
VITVLSTIVCFSIPRILLQSGSLVVLQSKQRLSLPIQRRQVSSKPQHVLSHLSLWGRRGGLFQRTRTTKSFASTAEE